MVRENGRTHAHSHTYKRTKILANYIHPLFWQRGKKKSAVDVSVDRNLSVLLPSRHPPLSPLPHSQTTRFPWIPMHLTRRAESLRRHCRWPIRLEASTWTDARLCPLCPAVYNKPIQSLSLSPASASRVSTALLWIRVTRATACGRCGLVLDPVDTAAFCLPVPL